MIDKSNRVRITGGMMTDKKGRGIDSLEEAMEEQAKCCGISCCDNVIRLDDRENGNKYEMGFVNGVLSFRIAFSEDPFVAV